MFLYITLSREVVFKYSNGFGLRNERRRLVKEETVTFSSGSQIIFTPLKVVLILFLFAGFKGIWGSGLSISAQLGVRDNNEASWTQVSFKGGIFLGSFQSRHLLSAPCLRSDHIGNGTERGRVRSERRSLLCFPRTCCLPCRCDTAAVS